MRGALALAFALHAAAIALLALYGAPRQFAEAADTPAGIVVVFSEGGGGERAGDTVPEEAPAEAPAEPPAEDLPEAAAAAPATPPEQESAEPVEAEPERAEQAEALPEPAEEPAPPASASALPLPPPLPPDAPPPSPPPQPERARTEPPKPRPEPPPAHAAATPGGAPQEGGSAAPEEGSAAFLLATRPASVGHRVDPVVPIEARMARMQGRVELVVTISPEGIPTEVEVLRSSGYFMLDTAAQEALWQWRFDPARRGGVPVEEKIVIPFNFRIVN